VTADLRAALRRDLTAALKSRQAEVVSVLRNALAAIENAEALPVSAVTPHVAGAPGGLGSTEAPRRELSPEDVRGLLEALILDFKREARRYDSLGQSDAARRLEGQAGVLSAYLPVPRVP
jgi:uncharacterized protein